MAKLFEDKPEEADLYSDLCALAKKHECSLVFGEIHANITEAVINLKIIKRREARFNENRLLF